MERRLSRDIINCQPYLVLINGSLNWPAERSLLSVFEETLLRIVKRIQVETEADIILMTPNVEGPSPFNPNGSTLPERVEINRRVAAEKNNVEHELITLVRERKHHLGTGFLSTPFLQKGDSSRNHYSNGAVCEWIFNTVCGISIVGENRFIISPQSGGSLTVASLMYRSVYGKVSCSLKKEGAHCAYRIEIPARCQAEMNIQGFETNIIEAGKHLFEVLETVL